MNEGGVVKQSFHPLRLGEANKEASVLRIDPAQLKAMIRDRGELALIDVREPLLHGGGHPLLAVNIPLSQLELRFARAVPRRTTRTVLFDGGEGFAEAAGARLEGFGYTNVAVMTGGVTSWADAGYQLFADQRVLAKGFSAFIEQNGQPDFITAEALKLELDRSNDVIVLDARPGPEYRVSNIPGSIDVPGPDLLRRFDDLVPSPNTLVVVNCMSRTRGILGALSLVRGGVPNKVVALLNGTSGWRVAGLELEHNANSFGPPLSDAAQANARKRAARLASEAGIVFIDDTGLSRWQRDEERTTYVIDVRDTPEFIEGHLPGSISVPCGGLILHPEEVAATMNARLVVVDDDGVRANATAYWLEQMGLFEVAVLRSKLGLQNFVPGDSNRPVLGLDTAVAKRISTGALASLLASDSALLVDLGPSASYKTGHIPGAYFAIRAYLADALAALPSLPAQLVLTSPDGVLGILAAAEAARRTHRPVAVLDGGTGAWEGAGRPMEAGPKRMLSPEHDRLPRAHERPGDLRSNLRTYLDWETNLLEQIELDGDAPYRTLAGR